MRPRKIVEEMMDAKYILGHSLDEISRLMRQAAILRPFTERIMSASAGHRTLFETMIFGGALDEFQNCCSTWDQAEAMRNEAVTLARTGHLRVVK
jgi:hypothetical protein